MHACMRWHVQGAYLASCMHACIHRGNSKHVVRGSRCCRCLGLALAAVLPADIGADAIKTGMLPNAEAVAVVADKVRQARAQQRAGSAAAGSSSSAGAAGACSVHERPLLVVDPVMVSTSGHELAGQGVARALLDTLLPLATLATPNIPEASALLGAWPSGRAGVRFRAGA